MPQPFVVPEGVVFLIEEDGVTIENQGDVVLHTDFGGRTLKRIVSREGSINLHTSSRAGLLEAAGSVWVGGSLHADAVRAGAALAAEGDLELREVNAESVSTSGNLKATTLVAAGGVSTGGAFAAERADVGGSVACGSARVGRLNVAGSLTVNGDAELGALSIGGDARFGGNVAGTTIRANVVEIGAGAVTARGIQGRTRVVIGAAKLTVDAVLAPEVQLDPRTSGRVTVVESHNEVGPSAIKGGFRLADFAEMFGDASAFLAERGLTPLDAAEAAEPVAAVHVEAGEGAEPEPQAAVELEAAPEAEAEPSAEAEAAGEENTTDPESIEAGEADADAEEEAAARQEEHSGPAMVAIPHTAPEPARAEEPAAQPVPDEEPAQGTTEEGPAEPVVVQAVEEEADAGIEAAPAGDPLAAVVEHPMHAQLTATIQRIVDCYVNAELPSAVERLRGLAEGRAYPEIRAEITNIWSELLKFHQKKGIRIHPMVTTTFNSVNSLVKKM